MRDQLFNLIQQHAGKSIIQNQAIPNQFNEPVMKEMATQMFNALQGQVAQGNLQQVVQLFQVTSQRGMNGHPVVGPMIQNIAASLSSRFNLPADVTRAVAESVVPAVMSQVINKTNDPRDIDFDLQLMMRRLSGNNTLDISGMMGQAPKGGIGNIGNIFGKLFGK